MNDRAMGLGQMINLILEAQKQREQTGKELINPQNSGILLPEDESNLPFSDEKGLPLSREKFMRIRKMLKNR